MSERVSMAEPANKTSSAEQENGWAARANERADEQMALYSIHQFHRHSTQKIIEARVFFAELEIEGGWHTKV